MIEINLIELALGFIAGVVVFAMGWKLGHAVGFNDGLRRAHDIIDEVHR